MYEDFYRLLTKPFRLSPDSRFFFASREHEQVLINLRYDLSRGEGFVVVTGAPGTGKTTLAQVILKEMDPDKVVVGHITTTQLDPDDILRMVVASLGMSYEGIGKPDLLMALGSYLLDQSRLGKRVLLVVDEAQNLPPGSIEEFRMLSNLQVGKEVPLQVFLLGQTQLSQMLVHRDFEHFRQRVIANYHLDKLAEDECQQYIESRLRLVGWHGDPHFTDAAFHKIYQHSQGVPRRINMICDRLMLFGCLEGLHEINADLFCQVTDEIQNESAGHQIEFTNLMDDTESSVKTLYQQSEQVGDGGRPNSGDQLSSGESMKQGITIEEIEALELDLDFELISSLEGTDTQGNKKGN